MKLLKHTGIYFLLGFVGTFIEGAVEQPLAGTPIFFLLRGLIVMGGILCSVMSLALVLNYGVLKVIAPRSKPEAVDYYPRLSSISGVFRSKRTRLLMVVGLILVLAYCLYIYVEYDYSLRYRAHGLVWRPHRIASSIYLVWSILWVGDTLYRKEWIAVPPLLIFMAWSGFYLYAFGFTMLVE